MGQGDSRRQYQSGIVICFLISPRTKRLLADSLAATCVEMRRVLTFRILTQATQPQGFNHP